MKFKLSFFKKNQIDKIVNASTPEAIQDAYNKRYAEIESLRKYDKGEKKIDAPNLRNLVRSL